MGGQQTSEEDLDRQIIDLGHAIALNPKHPNAYRDRALLFVKKCDFIHALIDLGQAILLNSKDAVAYYFRSRIWLVLAGLDLRLRSVYFDSLRPSLTR